MAEIIREWAGYNGKVTEEKMPDGKIKITKHNKVWAAALTDTGYVYVRYGTAKHPLKLTEQIIRPKPDLAEYIAFIEAERIFQEKVEEKREKRGYDTIAFDADPHFVPSFSRVRMSNEPEEVVAPVCEVAPPPREELRPTLQRTLDALGDLLLEQPCPGCKTRHPRYLIDIGDGKVYVPQTIVALLGRTDGGTGWLSAPCLRQEDALIHAETREPLASVLDCGAEGSPNCAFRSAVTQVSAPRKG